MAEIQKENLEENLTTYISLKEKLPSETLKVEALNSHNCQDLK